MSKRYINMPTGISFPFKVGTERTYTTDPRIEDRHLAQAVRQIAQHSDVKEIYEQAAIIAAKESK